jgi:hypothetical protein
MATPNRISRKYNKQKEKHLFAYKLLLDEYRHIGTADLTQLQRESNQADQGTAVMLGMDKTSRRQTKRLIKRKMEKELKILKRDFGITIIHDHPVDKPVPAPAPAPAVPSEADTMAMLLAKIAELEGGAKSNREATNRYYDPQSNTFHSKRRCNITK